MSAPTKHPPGSQAAQNAHGTKHHGHPGRGEGGGNEHHTRHRERPCGNPPAKPTGVTVTFQATEAQVHLLYTAKVKWAEVTADEQGHPVNIKRYDVEMRATNSSGVPQEAEDGRTRLRAQLKFEPTRFPIISATIVSGTTAEFTLKRPQTSMVATDKVVVSGMKPTGYNGTWTISSVISSTVFRADIGTSPAAAYELGNAFEDADHFFVISRTLPRPTKWYWQARVRAIDKDNCAGDWSAWTTQLLPFDSAAPKPPAPTGLTLSFDNIGRDRYRRFRGYAVWNEVVNFDYPGTPADDEQDVSAYAMQMQISDDGIVGNDRVRHFPKIAKDADGDGTSHHTFMVGHNNYYRVRVRAIDRYNRRGDWSGWTQWLRPVDTNNPPRPTNVRVFNNSNEKVNVDWDPPTDPLDSQIVHIDVAYFQVQISQGVAFGAIYKFDRFVHATEKHLRVADADLDEVFYARVRSVDASGRKSAWVPATLVGNSSISASPDGVIPGSREVVATWTKDGTVEVKHYPQLWTSNHRYRFIKARARCGKHDTTGATHPNTDGCPVGATLKINLYLHNTTETTETPIFDADTRLKIDTATHRDALPVSAFAIQHIDPDESLSVKVTQVGSTVAGSDLVVQMFMELRE